MRRVLIIVGILLLPVIPVVLVVTGVIKGKPTEVNRVNLLIWTSEDDKKALTELVDAYRIQHSYVRVTIETVRPEDYKAQLVNAWAQGNGPDIFFAPHTWVTEMQSFAAAMPADITVPIVQITKGWLGERRDVFTPKVSAPTVSQVNDVFVDAAASDVLRGSQIWGLPLAMDTIALYSNKDLLNNAKIFEPAKTWAELVNHVDANAHQLTTTDELNNLVQSGVALGTATNIPYAVDILTLLMMQNGSTMTTDDGKTRFQEQVGLDAVDFYTSFALSSRKSFSWTAEQPNARDAFIQGKVAYYFGTYADRAEIAKSSVKWSVTPMPHLQATGDATGRLIDAARYNIGMVSKAAQTGRRSTQAWNLLYYMAQASNVKNYLASTGKLSAQKKILNTQKDIEEKSVFAAQLLTAKTWYRGRDAAAMEKYLSDMITAIVKDGTTPKEALDLAAKQVESTL